MERSAGEAMRQVVSLLENMLGIMLEMRCAALIRLAG
jgi:hypothetical protein